MDMNKDMDMDMDMDMEPYHRVKKVTQCHAL
jgi:hypothetical protein